MVIFLLSIVKKKNFTHLEDPGINLRNIYIYTHNIHIYIYIHVYTHKTHLTPEMQTASLPNFKARYDATRSAATAGPATVPRRYEAATVGASKCRDMKAQWFGKKND